MLFNEIASLLLFRNFICYFVCSISYNNLAFKKIYLVVIFLTFEFVIDPEGKYEALEKYGKDLTAMAKAGKLDPVIGRDDEIRRCIQILSRRTKNNPVLIGEPGVGKTAISEG